MFGWTRELVCQAKRTISPWRKEPLLAGNPRFLVGEVYRGARDTLIIDHIKTLIRTKEKGRYKVSAGMWPEPPELPWIVAKVVHFESIITGAIIDHVKRFGRAGKIICESVIG